jgi:alkaline phosphatase D
VLVLHLEADSWFFYRFRTGSHTSAVGQTRTMPRATDVPKRFVLAAANCQNYSEGFYAAHRDIAAAKPDAVVFLGDYIYEAAAVAVGTGGTVRSHETPEPATLAEYRNRYALYKSDPDLQAAHAACPWAVIWDDHEVENNYAGLQSENASVSPTAFGPRREAAYQAWWEHMPVRLPAPNGAKDYQIYRQLSVGRLIELTLIDSRQYRSDQTCGDVTLSLDPACPETFEPDRTMLGAKQEEWFAQAIGSTGAVWSALLNQVILANLQLSGAVLNYDMWDGYPAARDRLLQAVVDSPVENFVVITGDIHFAAAGDLRGPGSDPGRPVIGTEFVTASISSGANIDARIAGLQAVFPDIAGLEFEHRGWTKHIVTPDTWTAEWRTVTDVKDPDSTVTTAHTFEVRAGVPGVVRPG